MFIEILGKCVGRWSPTWGAAGAIVVALAVPSPVAAGTIRSNLGPGSTFFCCSAIIGARGSAVGNLAAATPFVTSPVESWELTQIGLGLELWGGSNSAIIQLRDSVGGFPGATIASWTLTGLPGFFVNTALQPSQTITGITGIRLEAGTEYWLAVIAGAPNTEIGWRQNAIGETNLKADSLNGGLSFSWYTLNANVAFEVQGTMQPVPEPASLLLLGSGLIALRRFRRITPSARPEDRRG